MFSKEIDSLCDAAIKKSDMSKNSPLRYITSAIIAGFFIVVAIILSNITAAVFYKSSPELSKFLGSILFPIAIILIVFVGGDLFTGNNMTMAFGLYNNKVKFSSALRVCIMSYIGNFIGTFILGGLLVLSGCASEVLTDYYSAIIPGKLELDPLTLFIRGVLCNYLVCTINEGEGTVKKIYTYFCYSLLPYVVYIPFSFILSHILTTNEQFLITLLNYVIVGWIVVLIILGIKEVNNYTAKETAKVIFITIFTILIMALIIFIIYVLWAQVFEFISAVFGEVVYRFG